MKASITLLIVTCDRPDTLQLCFQSLKQSTYKAFALIIVDQSTDTLTKRIIKEYEDTFNILYVKMKRKGKSKGLNIGLRKSTTSLIAFTDDDCIISSHWLERIVDTFSNNPDIAGVFGRTLAYEPDKHRGLICPSTTEHLGNEARVIHEPGKHWEIAGLGNNMAFRKIVIDTYGSFKDWLGPGSIGSNAEDGEMILRLLLLKQKLYYNPAIVTYHNRWLTPEQFERQYLSYVCGEMACYSYFAFRNNIFAQNVIRDNLTASLKELKLAVRSTIRMNGSTMSSWVRLWNRCFARLRGLAVGIFYSMRTT